MDYKHRMLGFVKTLMPTSCDSTNAEVARLRLAATPLFPRLRKSASTGTRRGRPDRSVRTTVAAGCCASAHGVMSSSPVNSSSYPVQSQCRRQRLRRRPHRRRHLGQCLRRRRRNRRRRNRRRHSWNCRSRRESQCQRSFCTMRTRLRSTRLSHPSRRPVRSGPGRPARRVQVPVRTCLLRPCVPAP